MTNTKTLMYSLIALIISNHAFGTFAPNTRDNNPINTNKCLMAFSDDDKPIASKRTAERKPILSDAPPQKRKKAIELPEIIAHTDKDKSPGNDQSVTDSATTAIQHIATVPVKKRTRIILSLPGGGARGMFTATVLSKLHTELSDRNITSPKIDMIVSTSVGAMIGSAIANYGLRYASTIEAQFPQWCKRIFQPVTSETVTSVKDIANTLVKASRGIERLHCFTAQFTHKILHPVIDACGTICNGAGNLLLNRPKYTDKGKISIVRELIGDTIGAQLSIPFIAVYHNPRRNQPVFWSSHPLNSPICFNGSQMRVSDAVLASSAAPTFFKEHIIDGELYVDGGVSVNNPELQALLIARAQFPHDEIHVFSIGTGCITNFTHLGNGLMPWAIEGSNVFMASAANSAHMTAQAILTSDPHMHLHNLQFNTDHLATDDISDVYLATLASQAYHITTKPDFSEMVNTFIQRHIEELDAH